MLDKIQKYDTNDAFIQGYGQVFGATVDVFSIIAAFIGLRSVSEERLKSSLNILLTKPVYRKDVVAGKFFGSGMFLLTIITIIELLTGLILIIYYREPYSAVDYLWRLVVFILSYFALSMLIMGLSMLIGIFIKNVLVASTTVAIYIFLELLSGIGIYLPYGPITPYLLYNMILTPNDSLDVFRSTVPFSAWFPNALPYILLMIVVILGVLFLNCWVFSKQADVN